MNKVYLQLEFKTGRLFEYSKEVKEGYEAYTNTEGNISYRKYYKGGITGELDSVSVRDTKFGQQLSFTLKDADVNYYVPFAIYTQSGNVDGDFMESIIATLPNLQKGNIYTINPYNFLPEGEKYAKRGVSFKTGSEKVAKALTNSYTNKEGVKVEGDIPAVVWVEKLGKKKPSAASLEEKDNFLLSIIERETERLKWTPSNNSNQGSYSAPVAEEKKTAMQPAADFDDEDLPF
jgi:hypothetical protein